uniref:OJ1005_B10.14 protein n=1 Tax=Oryza sativa subsp. japonica TaxID=39947 RepID=Q7EZN8_ORYSJ|nr:OJ1005_B10.14 [Oryza sativa Japonica Group]
MLPDLDIRDEPSHTPSGAYGSWQEGSSVISDLDEYGFEEEDYRVVDYELMNKEQHRLRPTGCRAITCNIMGLNLYKNLCLHLFYLNLAYTLVPTIPIPSKYRSRDIRRRHLGAVAEDGGGSGRHRRPKGQRRPRTVVA